MKGIKIPKQDKDKIISAYKNGASLSDITKNSLYGGTSIWRVIKQNKINRSVRDGTKLTFANGRIPKTIISKKDKRDIIKYYASGLGSGELSKIFPYKKQTITAFLRRKKLTRTRGEAQKLAYKNGIKKAATKPGENHPFWIKDRNKIKKKRMFTEELWFFKEVFMERGRVCQLTGKKGGELSIHHIKPVWKYPELIFDKTNVIVIQLDIHRLFHKLYGTKSTEQDWYEFVLEGGYDIDKDVESLLS